MTSAVSLKTYERLKKIFKDEIALKSFLTDLDKKFDELEKLSKDQIKNLENNLYSRLVQKFPTKEEFKSEISRLEIKIESEIKRLEDKIESEIKRLEEKIENKAKLLERKIENEIKRLEGKIESEVKRLEGKIESEIKRLEGKIESEVKRLEGKIESEIKRLEGKIENLSNSIDIKFKIVIGLIILGFTIFNPNFANILKWFFSLFK